MCFQSRIERTAFVLAAAALHPPANGQAPTSQSRRRADTGGNSHPDTSMTEDKPKQPPGTSGYPEPTPKPNRKEPDMPDAQTPHEPQNDPDKKPMPSS